MDHHHHLQQPAFTIKRKPVGFKDPNTPIGKSTAVDAEPEPQQQPQADGQSQSGVRPHQAPVISNSGFEEDVKGKSLVAVVASPPPPYESCTATPILVQDQEATTVLVADHTAENNSQQTDNSSSSPSFLKTALDEARYFAGGLLPRPHESTKHYTILRHSPSIIFYSGPATSVAVTVFSSPPPSSSPMDPDSSSGGDTYFLPADRTVWLQQRGFSGDTGMKLKRLVGATTSGNWLDVTPTTLVPEQDAFLTSAADERGWRRDIAKFMKKHAALHKTGRWPRETLVVRLPALVQDGYFRLVLCTGGGGGNKSSSRRRKVLCSSPIFRVASTSIDPSIMRGASLKTLPLELGVMVGATVGMGRVKAVLSPVANKVQSRLQALPRADNAATRAATSAYAATSGLREKVSAAEAQYHVQQQQARDAAGAGGTEPDAIFGKMEEGTSIELGVVGSDDGPERPFPLRFVGNVVPGTGGRRSIPGVPTANLRGITPDETLFRLKGTYLGWVRVVPTKSTATKKEDSQKNLALVLGGGGGGDWCEAVIRAGPSAVPLDGARKASAVVAPKHAITVHLIHDFVDDTNTTLLGAKLEVMVLGVLPSSSGPALQQVPDDVEARGGAAAVAAAAASVVERNIQVALSSLSRARWGPQATLQTIQDWDRAHQDHDDNRKANDNSPVLAPSRATTSFSDKYVAVRRQVQQRADSVPLHLAGVRTAGAEARDRVVGNGGYWIPRSSAVNY